MTVIISPRAEKQLRKISKFDQIAIANKIRVVANDPPVVREEKLKGFHQIYRVRVGNYRIVYRRSSKDLYIVLIGHRRDIYKLLQQLLG